MKRSPCFRCGLSDLIGKHDTAEDCLTHLEPRYRMLRRTHKRMQAQVDAALSRAERWKIKANVAQRRIAELEGSQSTEKRLYRLERQLRQLAEKQ